MPGSTARMVRICEVASVAITDEVLDHETVWASYQKTFEWLAETYLDALNCIHYMHDKYAYARLEMALHDQKILHDGLWHRRAEHRGRLPVGHQIRERAPGS